MSSRITVIGLGYIGLPTAALFARHGHRVCGVDIRQDVVDAVNAGQVHIVEPRLEDAIQEAVSKGRMNAATDPRPADAFLLAVPTPLGSDHQPDLSYIQQAAQSIAPVLEPGNLVILESTVPVGTTERLSEWLADLRPDLSFPTDAGELADIRVAYCPERVIPGNAMTELVENERVIGGLSNRSTDQAKALYRRIVRGKCHGTDARTAEMCKLVENSARDVSIAFANELSILCDNNGVDVWRLIDLANRHPRINILHPGAGVGGHCIAIDPWFLIAENPEDAQLIHSARCRNQAKPDWVVQKILEKVSQILKSQPGRALSDFRIVCMGLAFKPDIDDLRESPALRITSALGQQGLQVAAVEPHITTLPEELGNLPVNLANPEHAFSNADLVCILVKHSEFSKLVDQIDPDIPVMDFVGLGS
ncbi:MAG: UDP-N-acetyl-D-mannosamine dehydrogenase [Paracoccaceae bacterium]